MITLLPHQLRASAELEAILRAHRIAYLAGMVRTGKTLTAMHLVKTIGFKRVLLVTKKKAIASIEKDRDALGLTDVVTVTNFEQLPKFAKQSFGLLIVDEAHACVLGNTLVDGVKIKDIEVGSFLNTLNLASGRVERKRVMNVIANPLTERLVKIKADGKEIVCTESHEVFTSKGWKRAGDITTNDEVCTQWMRNNASSGSGVRVPEGKNKRVLFQEVRGTVI